MMKRLTVGLAVLLSGYAANSFASLPNGNTSRCDVCAPSYCGGFTFGVTGLYWRPTTNHLDFALTFPNSDDNGDPIFSNGNFHRLNHDYDWGWRANVGYIFPCSGNDVVLSYTHWNNNRRHHTENFGAAMPTTFSPFFDDDGVFNIIFPASSFKLMVQEEKKHDHESNDNGKEKKFNVEVPTPTFAFALTPADIDHIHARSRFEDNTWDLDFGQTIHVGCNFRIRWFGGLRYTRLKHNLDAVADFSATGTTVLSPIQAKAKEVEHEHHKSDDINPPKPPKPEEKRVLVTPVFDVVANVFDATRQKADFHGVGPHFGIDASYHFGGGFGVIGNISTSLLVGREESHFHERIEQTATATFDRNLSTVVEEEQEKHHESYIDENGHEHEKKPEQFKIVEVKGSVLTPVTPVIERSFRHPNETRVVPNIDAKLGLDWTYQFCNCSRSRLTIEAGYMVSHYFDALERLSGLELFEPAARARCPLNVSFDGPFVGVQVAL